ncbi:MAG: hypothetical protein HQL31_06820 [Planctomycetes bacterium]|nr:hypothetical protein [Planctomycetota bacterium]
MNPPCPAMSPLFGIVSCPSCNQKVNLIPEDILSEGGKYRFQCKRCKKIGVLPEDFIFKSPTMRNMTISEALQRGSRSSLIPEWLRRLFSRPAP